MLFQPIAATLLSLPDLIWAAWCAVLTVCPDMRLFLLLFKLLLGCGSEFDFLSYFDSTVSYLPAVNAAIRLLRSTQDRHHYPKAAIKLFTTLRLSN